MAFRASVELMAGALCAPAAAVVITASNAETRMCPPRFLCRKLQHIEVPSLDFIRFSSSCKRCWLSALTDRPDNGRDLPLPIKFAQLPVRRPNDEPRGSVQTRAGLDGRARPAARTTLTLTSWR